MEYVGEREWVEKTLNNGGIPSDGSKEFNNGNIIKSCLVDRFPEIVGKEK